MKTEGHTLYFAVSPLSETYAQLQDNNRAEALAWKGGISVRLEGKVHFDVPDETCRDIYNESKLAPAPLYQLQGTGPTCALSPDGWCTTT